MMEPLLSIQDLHVEFTFHGATIQAVRGISFDIRHSSTVALVGESGSGKSVTAQAIMGILPDKVGQITRGRILLADKQLAGTTDLAALNPQGPAMRSIRGGRISMIFQEPMVSLSPLHTVGDQVSEALFLHRDVGKPEGLKLTEEMLGLVGFPDPAAAMDTYPFELSGGLRQRAMIAMALVCRPSLLIADEPTTALDVTIQAQILDLIVRLQRELGMAVLIITHDLGVVANLAQEVVVLYHGEVMEAGTVDAIFRNPQHPYLEALLRAVPHFDMQEGERLTPVREVEYELGPLLRREAVAVDRNAPALRVDQLNRGFITRKQGWFGLQKHETVRAVIDVGFTVMRGECFGLVGESGCGKTTVSKVIMRALRPDSGTIRYFDDGREVDLLALQGNALMQFRRKFQYIFQDPFSSLNPRMTVFDIVREPLVIHKIGDAPYQADLVKELMRMVGLDPRFLNRYPHSFSGGQRQRIGIARALALSPDFIICDEPVSALDVSIQAQVLNLLKDLQAELGLTYLFISHNLAVVDYMARRIAVMCKGRIVEVARREDLFENPIHPYTKALLAAVPFVDLDHPLDIKAVMEGRTSEPRAWPEPFTVADHPTHLVDTGEEHLVRVMREDVPRRAAA